MSHKVDYLLKKSRFRYIETFKHCQEAPLNKYMIVATIEVLVVHAAVTNIM